MRNTAPRAGLAAAILVTAGAVVAAQAAGQVDPASQIGPNPPLPAPRQYLFPPMHLAKVVGWKMDETPTVAKGLKIEALARGLQHPRSLYVLPNGDVLVVESKGPNVQPIRRPKDFVMGMIESWVTGGGDTGPSNRITLLRDENGDGYTDLVVREATRNDRYSGEGDEPDEHDRSRRETICLYELAGDRWVCPEWPACRTEVDGVELRADGVHFNDEGARVVARWLTPQLLAAAGP